MLGKVPDMQSQFCGNSSVHLLPHEHGSIVMYCALGSVVDFKGALSISMLMEVFHMTQYTGLHIILLLILWCMSGTGRHVAFPIGVNEACSHAALAGGSVDIACAGCQ